MKANIFFQLLSLDKNSTIYNEFKNDFTYHSSRIEGSTITSQQNSTLISNHEYKKVLLKTVDEKYVIENFNLITAFEYVVDNYAKPLNSAFIKKLHKILHTNSPDLKHKNEKAGEYRNKDVIVGTHVGARPQYISSLINKLIDTSTKYMSIYDVAAFHCEYETIHPFYDGNGRTGRLIVLKQCLANNIIPFFVDDYSKQKYYFGFKYYQTKNNNASAMTDYFIERQEAFMNKYSGHTSLTPLSTIEKKIVNYIKINGQISRLQAEKITKLSTRTVKTIMMTLQNKNVIKKSGLARSSVYILKTH
ncbi:MAG: hypothetical protein Ta2E_03130 [Mycoplasmoidaceae bacterium]|nr:MAG: hypothetical protein Ta2E_03130 [Mycoplasmoidaceae bacterium]